MTIRFTRLQRLAVVVLGCSVFVSGCVPALLAGGVGAAAVVANDRRTSDTLVADERIEWTVTTRLRQSGYWEQLNLNVTSFNRSLLLTGQAANERAKSEADRIASEIPGVRGVTNELVVREFSNFAARSNDSFITTQVKGRMVNAQSFNPIHVKVVTESAVVYLLGLVTRTEADEATKIAAATPGVSKVVRVFEYLPDSTPSASK